MWSGRLEDERATGAARELWRASPSPGGARTATFGDPGPASSSPPSSHPDPPLPLCSPLENNKKTHLATKQNSQIEDSGSDRKTPRLPLPAWAFFQLSALSTYHCATGKNVMGCAWRVWVRRDCKKRKRTRGDEGRPSDEKWERGLAFLSPSLSFFLVCLGGGVAPPPARLSTHARQAAASRPGRPAEHPLRPAARGLRAARRDGPSAHARASACTAQHARPFFWRVQERPSWAPGRCFAHHAKPHMCGQGSCGGPCGRSQSSARRSRAVKGGRGMRHLPQTAPLSSARTLPLSLSPPTRTRSLLLLHSPPTHHAHRLPGPPGRGRRLRRVRHQLRLGRQGKREMKENEREREGRHLNLLSRSFLMHALALSLPPPTHSLPLRRSSALACATTLLTGSPRT